MDASSYMSDLRARGFHPQGSRQCKFKSSFEGLKWAGIQDLIVGLAAEHRLRMLELRARSTSWIHSEVRFQVEGLESDVWSFAASMVASIEQYEAA